MCTSLEQGYSYLCLQEVCSVFPAFKWLNRTFRLLYGNLTNASHLGKHERNWCFPSSPGLMRGWQRQAPNLRQKTLGLLLDRVELNILVLLKFPMPGRSRTGLVVRVLSKDLFCCFSTTSLLLISASLSLVLSSLFANDFLNSTSYQVERLIFFQLSCIRIFLKYFHLGEFRFQVFNSEFHLTSY